MKTRKPRKTESNKTLLQGFEYYLEDNGRDTDPKKHHWNILASQAEMYKNIGITGVWLPPAYKSWGMADSVGYAVYDKYDLGQYEQQGRTNTRYGSKEDLDRCIKSLKAHHLNIIVDIVMNHMMGGEGDASIKTTVTECDEQDRLNVEKRVKVKKESWPVFRFDNRRNDPSSPNQDVWDKNNFTGFVSDPTDKDQYLDGRKADLSRRNIPYLYEGKEWAQDVDWELGNYDALMGLNLDMSCPDTRRKLIEWGKWFVKETQADGVRIDAVKHISASFMRDWLNEVTLSVAEDRGRKAAESFFAVGEYWSEKQDRIEHYLQEMNQSEPIDDPESVSVNEVHEQDDTDSIDEIQLRAFDVQLHKAMTQAYSYNYEYGPYSKAQEQNYNMAQLFNNSLLFSSYADNAVTFVDNHDTEAGQPLGPAVSPRFKQQAYALIMFLNRGIPCVFYGDLFGIPHYQAMKDWEYDDEHRTEEEKKRKKEFRIDESISGLIPEVENGQANQNRCNEMMHPVTGLKRMCRVRKSCAHGGQLIYIGQGNKFETREENGSRFRCQEFEENDVHVNNVIGYTRSGGGYTYGGMAVLVSNRGKDHENDYAHVQRKMLVSEKYAGKEFIDILHPDGGTVTLDEHGYGTFYVEKAGTAVWIRKVAYDYLMREEEFRNDI